MEHSILGSVLLVHLNGIELRLFLGHSHLKVTCSTVAASKRKHHSAAFASMFKKIERHFPKLCKEIRMLEMNFAFFVHISFVAISFVVSKLRKHIATLKNRYVVTFFVLLYPRGLTIGHFLNCWLNILGGKNMLPRPTFFILVGKPIIVTIVVFICVIMNKSVVTYILSILELITLRSFERVILCIVESFFPFCGSIY